jgi:hypothetical protein
MSEQENEDLDSRSDSSPIRWRAGLLSYLQSLDPQPIMSSQLERQIKKTFRPSITAKIHES